MSDTSNQVYSEIVDAFSALEQAWTNPDMSLYDRARLISSLHIQGRLTLEGTARMTGATPVQIQAILELADLDDEDLEKISNAKAPATTWLLFARATSPAIQAGLTAMSEQKITHGALLLGVYDAMRSVMGPTRDERIAGISGSTLGHLAHKAKEYSVLSPRARKFLVSLAMRKSTGQSITQKQLDWLKSILLDLVESKVIAEDSSDGDQEACNEVFEALGMK